MRASAIATVIAVMLWLAPAAWGAAASTLQVSGFADAASGTCGAPDPSGLATCTTLRAAIAEADTQANAPQINLTAGTYPLTAAGGGELAVTASMTISGVAGQTTIEQTAPGDRVLDLSNPSAAVSLTGLEVTGGSLAPAAASGPAIGGGIFSAGSLTLSDVLVTANTSTGAAGAAGSGAGGQSATGAGIGLAPGAGMTAIVDSTISANSAIGGAGGSKPSGSAGAGGGAEGGGIGDLGASVLTIESSTVSGNSAIGGAGGSSTAGTPGTGGTAFGGGVANEGPMILAASTITADTVTGGNGGGAPATGADGYGGGIGTQEASSTIVNATIAGNSAQGGLPVVYPYGLGYGGGVQDNGSAAALTLASDTIAGNDGSYEAGDLYVSVGVGAPYPFTVQDTIIAGGVAPNAGDCQITTPASADANNLEDDAGHQCGFTSADHDLVGVSPDLQGAPQDNGGPAQTLAPAADSPALGAGGQCLDPTSTPPGQPLTTDERGQPRSDPCDIGAFEHQPTADTSPPTITGTPKVGAPLQCAPGTWTGDGLSFAYQWQLAGQAVPGATSSTYTVALADAGQTLRCAVTGSGAYGTASAVSGVVTVAGVASPALSLATASVRNGVITAGLVCRGVAGQACMGAVTLLSVESLRGQTIRAVTARRRPPARRPAGGRARTRTVTVGRSGFTIPAGRIAVVRLVLNGRGRSLLTRFHRLPGMLAVSQTIAAASHRVAIRRVTITPARRARRRGKRS